MSEERRRYRRIPCYVIAQEAGASEGEEDFFGIVRNLSRSGAMVETEHFLEIGARVDLVFMLDTPREFREGRGRVVWSRRREDKVVFGLQFDRPYTPEWETLISAGAASEEADPAAGTREETQCVSRLWPCPQPS